MICTCVILLYVYQLSHIGIDAIQNTAITAKGYTAGVRRYS